MSDSPSSPAISAIPGKGPVVLASSSGSISVQSAGTELSLTPEPAAVAGFVPALAAGGGPGPAIRMHVALENVRGTNDATVLRVFLRLALPSAGDETEETFLASAGLYGLRRASAPGAGHGLQCMLDVTSHAALLMREIRSEAGRLVLAIRPHRPMPEGTAISIERIRLIAEMFE